MNKNFPLNFAMFMVRSLFILAIACAFYPVISTANCALDLARQIQAAREQHMEWPTSTAVPPEVDTLPLSQRLQRPTYEPAPSRAANFVVHPDGQVDLQQLAPPHVSATRNFNPDQMPRTEFKAFLDAGLETSVGEAPDHTLGRHAISSDGGLLTYYRHTTDDHPSNTGTFSTLFLLQGRPEFHSPERLIEVTFDLPQMMDYQQVKANGPAEMGTVDSTFRSRSKAILGLAVPNYFLGGEMTPGPLVLITGGLKPHLELPQPPLTIASESAGTAARPPANAGDPIIARISHQQSAVEQRMQELQRLPYLSTPLAPFGRIIDPVFGVAAAADAHGHVTIVRTDFGAQNYFSVEHTGMTVTKISDFGTRTFLVAEQGRTVFIRESEESGKFHDTGKFRMLRDGISRGEIAASLSGLPHCVDFIPQRSLLATIDEGGSLDIARIQGGELPSVTHIFAPDGLAADREYQAVKSLPDGKSFLIIDGEGNLHRWSAPEAATAESGPLEAIWPRTSNEKYQVAISLDGRYAARFDGGELRILLTKNLRARGDQTSLAAHAAEAPFAWQTWSDDIRGVFFSPTSDLAIILLADFTSLQLDLTEPVPAVLNVLTPSATRTLINSWEGANVTWKSADLP